MPTLDFKGKQFIYGHHLTVPVHTLQIDADKSLTDENDPSLNDNLIIHGDNLHALKALLPKYAGKIKCIYIDPPYNTGNENWVYNDNVNSPMMQEWLGKIVDLEDMEHHEKWLVWCGFGFIYCMNCCPMMALFSSQLRILTGETLPTYKDLAHYIAYTATGNALTSITKRKDYYFGETNTLRFYLIYEPRLEFLESNQSALNGERAE